MRHIFLLLTLLFSTQLFAANITVPIHAQEAFLGPKQTRNEFDIDPSLHPSWLHRISAINYATNTITIDDGSKWKLGFAYGRILKQWQVDDQITLSWYQHTVFLDTQIKNYTKQSYAWSQMSDYPQDNTPGFLFIKQILTSRSIKLSDGTLVTSKQPWMFHSYKEGDIIVTLYGHGVGSLTQYSILNVSNSTVTFDLMPEKK